MTPLPVTHRLHADLGESFQPAADVPGLGPRVDPLHGFVQVTVVGHLVPGVHDAPDRVRVTACREAGNEEGGPNVLPLENLQQARHRHFGPVGLVGHEGHPARARLPQLRHGMIPDEVKRSLWRRSVSARTVDQRVSFDGSGPIIKPSWHGC